MKMYETTQPVEKYLNVKLECSCGRTHYAPIKAVKIGEGALKTLPDFVTRYGYRKPYLLCDKITYAIAGATCEKLLAEAGIPCETLVLRHLGYDEATLGEIVIHMPDDCDLMIGCGTGSITDMLRYASYKLGRPCFTIATGAPMDGFSASVGILNVNNLKATLPAHSTEVIIGDTEILSSAPYRMTIAGFGDLIGKLNALNDWRLAVEINGDHYCANMDHLVSDYVERILAETDKIKNRAPEAAGDVMNALLLTGATISLYGSSRPISGAEHHMSHYWEVVGEQRGRPLAMHGEQVAVGTVVALMAEECIREMEIDFDGAREKAALYGEKVWEEEIRRCYGNAADAIIELEAVSQKNETSGRLRRIERMEQRWDSVKDILNRAYPAAALRKLLRELGSPCDPRDIGVDRELLRDTILYCKETRARYTVYQMAWDLGILEPLADRIIEKLEKEGAL